LHPTAAALPQGVVTRQSVVPAPPILVPQVSGPTAAEAEREIIVTITGLAQAAAAACRRNLRRERPSSEAALCRSSTRSSFLKPPRQVKPGVAPTDPR
jgi:hypothetical protein